MGLHVGQWAEVQFYVPLISGADCLLMRPIDPARWHPWARYALGPVLGGYRQGVNDTRAGPEDCPALLARERRAQVEDPAGMLPLGIRRSGSDQRRPATKGGAAVVLKPTPHPRWYGVPAWALSAWFSRTCRLTKREAVWTSRELGGPSHGLGDLRA